MLRQEDALSRGEELHRLGRYADADPLYRRAVEIARRSPGKHKLREITAMQKLGSNLADQARYAEAQPWLQSANAMAETEFGTDSLVTAKTMEALGDNFNAQEHPNESEPLYRRVLAIRQKALGGSHWETAVAMGRLADALSRHLKFGEAEQQYDAALQILARSPAADQIAVAEIENNLAYLLNSQGRYADADPHYRAALQIWRKAFGEQHPLVGSGYNNVASNLSDQGRYKEAESLYRRALDVTVSTLGANHPQVATRYNNLADTLAELGRSAEALELYRKAYALWRSTLPADHPLIAIGAHNIASSLVVMGKPQEAEPLMREAYRIELATLGPEDPATALTMSNLAQLLLDEGKAEEALPLRKQALAIQIKTFGNSHPATADAQISLAFHLDRLGKHQEAAVSATEAIQAARRAMKLVSGSSSLDLAKQDSADKGKLDQVFEHYMHLAWVLSDEDPKLTGRLKAESFLAAQDLLGVAPSRAMALAAARRNAGDPALEGLIREQQDLVTAAQEADGDLIAALSGNEPAKAKASQDRYESSVAKLAAIELQLGREFPRYRELVRPASMSLDEARDSLAPDEGLLFLSAAGTELHQFVVTRRGAWWTYSEDARGIFDIVTGLRCDVDELSCPYKIRRERERQQFLKPTADGSRPFDLKGAHQLYSVVIGPFEHELKDVKRLYVVSTGDFKDLPLALLVASKPRATSNPLRDAHWLSDRFAFTYLPSVSALGLRDVREDARGTTFVGYGAPTLKGSRPTSAEEASPASRGGYRADPENLRRLEPLPGTEVELEAMRGLFGASTSEVNIGDAATETQLRGDPLLPKANVLTFATHALLPDPGEGVDEPGLVLTPPPKPTAADDGFLAASEVAELSLDAQWVILSACNTASTQRAKGMSSLSALARAFLYAGAGSLLASHWRVSDEATAALTVETLRNWKTARRITRAQALQKAMHAVRTGKRDDGSAIAGWSPDWSHPAAWAPFTVIADHDQ